MKKFTIEPMPGSTRFIVLQNGNIIHDCNGYGFSTMFKAQRFIDNQQSNKPESQISDVFTALEKLCTGAMVKIDQIAGFWEFYHKNKTKLKAEGFAVQKINEEWVITKRPYVKRQPARLVQFPTKPAEGLLKRPSNNFDSEQRK